MIKLIRPNGGETWVHESRLDEYLGRGYAFAPPPEPVKNIAQETEEVPEEISEEVPEEISEEVPEEISEEVPEEISEEIETKPKKRTAKK